MHCRWRFVVHAGIDGYSRLPVYCHCSTDNRAQTVLQLFLGAADMYDLPSRVRCDWGTENYDVGYYMLSHPQHGPNRGSIIPGQSVHNQRIERVWRDLFVGCTCVFYHFFYHMEKISVLDPVNEVHLFCLHLVYKPYINYTIKLFICLVCTPIKNWEEQITCTALGRRDDDECKIWLKGYWRTIWQHISLRECIFANIYDYVGKNACNYSNSERNSLIP